MKTYQIIFRDNRGSFAIDALAASVLGSWHDTVEKYDGVHDIGYIDIDEGCAGYLEELLDSDENIVEYRDVTD